MIKDQKTTEVKADLTAKYISDVFPDGLPKNCILDKVTTGCGATYSALTSLRPTVIAVPTRNLVLDKVTQEQYKPFNILGVSSDFKFKGVPVGCNKIICTYESLAKISEHIDISKWDLVVDEMHTVHRMILLLIVSYIDVVHIVFWLVQIEINLYVEHSIYYYFEVSLKHHSSHNLLGQ